MLIRTEGAVRKAESIVRKYETRNADQLARELGLIVVPYNFVKQKGVHKVIERNRYIFIKADLHPVMHCIVLLHEIGHDSLHRTEAIKAGGFQEFNIFDMRDHRMEYEPNMFAAQIVRAMESDINLVALKIAELNRWGYSFREQEHRSDFLIKKSDFCIQRVLVLLQFTLQSSDSFLGQGPL